MRGQRVVVSLGTPAVSWWLDCCPAVLCCVMLRCAELLRCAVQTTSQRCQLVTRRSSEREASTCQVRRFWELVSFFSRLCFFSCSVMRVLTWQRWRHKPPQRRAGEQRRPRLPVRLPAGTTPADRRRRVCCAACPPAGGQKARLALARAAYSQAEIQVRRGAGRLPLAPAATPLAPAVAA